MSQPWNYIAKLVCIGDSGTYVISDFKPPLLDQILSLEACLGRSYSRNMFQGSVYPLR